MAHLSGGRSLAGEDTIHELEGKMKGRCLALWLGNGMRSIRSGVWLHLRPERTTWSSKVRRIGVDIGYTGPPKGFWKFGNHIVL
jgi:hypothetical protein